MRAVVISRPGGPEVLEFREVADPVHGSGEVLVQVAATALNRADLLQRRGRYPGPPHLPAEIPGLEFAGEVLAAGARVDALRPGDRVMGLVAGGACAERIAVDANLCMRLPPALGCVEAASVPEAFLTAYDALFRQARLLAGDVVLIHAAASGVGTAAIQLARSAGVRVVALSRTADKRRRLEQLGLLAVFDPELADLPQRVRERTGGAGVDAVLELLGPTLGRDLEMLRERGTVVVLGLLAGRRAELDLGRLLARRATIIGTLLRTRADEEKIDLIREFARRMLPGFAAGTLRPVIDRTLPWSAVREAHVALERNESFGKIVLRVAADG